MTTLSSQAPHSPAPGLLALSATPQNSGRAGFPPGWGHSLRSHLPSGISLSNTFLYKSLSPQPNRALASCSGLYTYLCVHRDQHRGSYEWWCISCPNKEMTENPQKKISCLSNLIGDCINRKRKYIWRGVISRFWGASHHLLFQINYLHLMLILSSNQN